MIPLRAPRHDGIDQQPVVSGRGWQGHHWFPALVAKAEIVISFALAFLGGARACECPPSEARRNDASEASICLVCQL
jgi:hypothetical protein